MPIEHLHATWFFASDDGDQEVAGQLERRLGGAVSVFEQVTVGRGALVLGARQAPDVEGLRCLRKGAEFALRSVDPASADPAIDGSPCLLAVRLWVPDGQRDEVRRWLDEEHSRAQLGVPGAHWFLGYEEVGAAHSFLNLWGIDGASVIDTPVWAAARDTPWRARLLEAEAFPAQDRAVYRPVGRPASSHETTD